MNKKIIIELRSKEDVKISQEVLDSVLERVTEGVRATDFDAEIKVV